MELEVGEQRGVHAAAAVSGDLDAAGAPVLFQGLAALIAGGAREVTLDLSGAEFIDSTGLGVLIRILRRLQAEGGSLQVVAANPGLRRLFEITGLAGDFFRIGPGS